MSALVDRVTASLAQRFPGREPQIRELATSFAQPDLPSESSLLLFDPRSPRHTAGLVRAALERIKAELSALETGSRGRLGPPKPELDYVVLSTLLVASPRLLFQAVLTAVASQSGRDSTAGPSRIGTDDALDSFGTSLARHIRQRTKGDPSAYRLCIVIDQAHRIRDLWSDFVIQGLMDIDRLLQDRGVPRGRVSVMLISHLPWHHYRLPSGAITTPGPSTIFFPPLTAEQTRATLRGICAPLYDSYRQSIRPSTAGLPHGAKRPPILSEATFAKLHSEYCSVAYESLRAETADLIDMLTASAAVWHVLLVPLQTGETTKFEELIIRAKPAFKSVLEQLHSRDLSPEEWVMTYTRNARLASLDRMKKDKAARDGVQVGSSVEKIGAVAYDGGADDARDNEYGAGDSDQEVTVEPADLGGQVIKRRRIALPKANNVPPLPTLSALLLVAAFVACHNPTKFDVNLFMRDESGLPGRKQKKGGGAVKSRALLGSKDNLARQQLTGPKAATLERVLAVFQSLLWESDPQTIKEAALKEVEQNETPQKDSQRGKEEEDVDDQSERAKEVEKVARSAAVMQRIKSLIAQRFLLATTKLDNLTSVSIQINITYEVAQALAKQVKLKIEDWLHDWKELFHT